MKIKKISYILSVVLICIVCLFLMGDKTYANSSSIEDNELAITVSQKSINGFNSLTLVGDNFNVSYGITDNVSEDFQLNNNEFIYELNSHSISIDSGKGSYVFDTEELHSYNEAILNMDFVPIQSLSSYDYKENNASVVFINEDLASDMLMTLDYIHIYNIRCFVLFDDPNDGDVVADSSGFVDISNINIEYIEPGTDEFSLFDVFSYINDIFVFNSHIYTDFENAVSIPFFTNISVGFKTSYVFHQFRIEYIQYTSSDPITQYLSGQLSTYDPSVDLWSDFFGPTINGFLNQEIFLGLTFGGIITICVAVPILLYILKVYFGG